MAFTTCPRPPAAAAITLLREEIGDASPASDIGREACASARHALRALAASPPGLVAVTRWPCAVLVIVVLCGWTSQAPANGRAHGQLLTVNAPDAGAAARQAAGMTGGKVLDVQTRFSGGRAVYLVKILLNDGRVKIIQIDGAPSAGPSAFGR